MSKLLNVKEVAEILCVSRKAVYDMMYNGKLPYIKMGEYQNSNVRFEEDSIKEYIEKHRVKAFAEVGA